MQDRKMLLQDLAYIFSYPQHEYRKRVERVMAACGDETDLARIWRPFAEYVQEQKFTGIEEAFTRTFDLRPSTCLEIGWHLYGEDYKRGQFLVKMRQTLAEYHIPESVELPDHLSHCLLLLAELPEAEADLFLQDYLKPALSKILTGFEPDNPFRYAIQFLDEILNVTTGICHG